MRVSKKGLSRLALDMFKVKLANNYLVFRNDYLGLRDEVIDKHLMQGYFAGASSEFVDFLNENIQEVCGSNFISPYEAFLEVCQVLETDSIEIWDMLDSVKEYLIENEPDTEIENGVEDQVERYADDPESRDPDFWREEEGGEDLVRRNLL